jgi:hypothetical protein
MKYWRNLNTHAQRETHSPSDEDWDELLEKTKGWGDLVEQYRQASIRVKRVVTNDYHRTCDILDALQSLKDKKEKIDRLYSRRRGCISPEQSPRALASQARYADCGSMEGTVEYRCRKDAQAQFETSRPSTRIEEVESHSSLPHPGTEEQSTSLRRYTRHMAESRARAAWRRPQGTDGPPLGRGGIHNDGPSSASSDEGTDSYQRPRRSWTPHDQAET